MEDMLNNWEQTVNLMDDDIREALHRDGYDTEASFLSAYMEAHEQKYGEKFTN